MVLLVLLHRVELASRVLLPLVYYQGAAPGAAPGASPGARQPDLRLQAQQNIADGTGRRRGATVLRHARKLSPKQ